MKIQLLTLLAAVAVLTADARPVDKKKCRPKGTRPVHNGGIVVGNPNYQPERPSYPWEHPEKPGVIPGHPSPYTPPTSGKEPWKPCTPIQVGQPYCPCHGNGNGNGNTTVPGGNTTVPGGNTNTTVPGGIDITKPLPNDNKPWNITIVHTNDIHAHLDQFNSGGADCTAKNIADGKCYGGIARIKTVVDKLRAAHNQSYLLDGGDNFQGTLFYTYYKGNVSADYMNAIEYDVTTVGNHELDDGAANLARFIKKLHFPVVSASMDVSGEPVLKDLVAPYTVLTKYGSRLGVVGFITSTLNDIAPLASKIKVEDPVLAVQRAVNELHAKGIKRIICVSHNGYQDDKRVAANTRGVSLIVGGHSHTLLNKNTSMADVQGPYPTDVKNLDGKSTYIVQAKKFGEWVGTLDLAWDKDSNLIAVNGDPIRLTTDIAKEPKFDAMVQEWRKPFDAIAQQVVGSATADLLNSGCTGKSCPLGNMVADAIARAYTGKRTDLPRIALVNSGGLRAGIQAGPINLGTILTVLPFQNFVVDNVVDGQYIKDLLENLASMQNAKQNKALISFGQVAGVRAVFDRKQPAGSKATNITVDVKAADGTVKQEPLDLKKQYVFVTIDFVATGGDNIVPTPFTAPTGALLSDAVLDYIKTFPEGKLPAFKDARLQ
ncbi:hypothetical protein GGF32_009993 [Allomyces javanicus]|nr:hypothetical protein GGF32_009993 [Allomyces javanicus]